MSESSSYVFRTSIGGFHKQDVSEYIETTAAAHQAQVSELQKQIDHLEQENQLLQSELETMQEQAIVSEAQSPQVVPEFTEAPLAESSAASLQEQELAAYRRAEAAERLACQLARKLYEEMQDICGRSTRAASDSSDAAQSAVRNIETQLETIRNSVDQMQSAIRSSAEELEAISQMVPDPAEELEV